MSFKAIRNFIKYFQLEQPPTTGIDGELWLKDDLTALYILLNAEWKLIIGEFTQNPTVNTPVLISPGQQSIFNLVSTISTNPCSIVGYDKFYHDSTTWQVSSNSEFTNLLLNTITTKNLTSIDTDCFWTRHINGILSSEAAPIYGTLNNLFDDKLSFTADDSLMLPNGTYLQYDIGEAKLVKIKYVINQASLANTKFQVSEDGTNWFTIFDNSVIGPKWIGQLAEPELSFDCGFIRYIRITVDWDVWQSELYVYTQTLSTGHPYYIRAKFHVLINGFMFDSQWSDVLTITNGWSYEKPTISSPSNGSSITDLTPTIIADSLIVNNETFSHNSSDWEIALDDEFEHIVFSSYDDTTNKLSITSSELSNNSQYKVRVKFKGIIVGLQIITEWSNIYSFNINI